MFCIFYKNITLKKIRKLAMCVHMSHIHSSTSYHVTIYVYFKLLVKARNPTFQKEKQYNGRASNMRYIDTE